MCTNVHIFKSSWVKIFENTFLLTKLTEKFSPKFIFSHKISSKFLPPQQYQFDIIYAEIMQKKFPKIFPPKFYPPKFLAFNENWTKISKYVIVIVWVRVQYIHIARVTCDNSFIVNSKNIIKWLITIHF